MLKKVSFDEVKAMRFWQLTPCRDQDRVLRDTFDPNEFLSGVKFVCPMFEVTLKTFCDTSLGIFMTISHLSHRMTSDTKSGETHNSQPWAPLAEDAASHGDPPQPQRDRVLDDQEAPPPLFLLSLVWRVGLEIRKSQHLHLWYLTKAIKLLLLLMSI